MCFSPEASFAAGAVLLGAGAVAARRTATRAPEWLPVALYPVAFGLQQLAEGAVWLDLDASAGRQASSPALAFLFFSHGFWPAWAPGSVWWLHRRGPRARVLLALTVAGAGVGAGLFLPLLLAGSVPVSLADDHIAYVTEAVLTGPLAPELVLVAYGVVVLVPFALSGRALLLAFGALIAAGMAVAQLFFTATLISVWCFFAAVVSAGVGLVLARGIRESHPAAAPGPLR